MDIVIHLVSALLLMLPIYIANMAPVIVRKVPLLNIPVDSGLILRGKRLFGAHKTWRGILFGMAAAIATTYVLSHLGDLGTLNWLTLPDYGNWLLIGTLCGAGALGGDLAESFIKRQLMVPDGHPFIPWDQFDFIIGGLLALSLVYVPQWRTLVLALIISPLLDIFINHLSFYLGIRNEKW